MNVEVIPVPGIPEVMAGDDLPSMIFDAMNRAGVELRPGDVVAVTQKIVSKAEGRVVPEGDGGKDSWVATESRRVVARRDDLVIAETRHGFVCANAGVDASNVAEGFLTLLPEDPDASAEEIRVALRSGSGAQVAVVVTDTFGRAWRAGLVNVAIGCAGLPALVDLRGTPDASGRMLEATIEAVADQVAAASGLVMGKSSNVPVAVVRGLEVTGPDRGDGIRPVVRPPREDLFRYSPLQAILARRSVRSFGAESVPRELVVEAVGAACTAPAPHHTRPWVFVALDRGAARKRLLTAMAQAWTEDLRSDGTSREVVDRRLGKSDALLAEAPLLIVPFVRLRGAHVYADEERAGAEREMFLLSGGAAIQNLMLGLHAVGLASCWVSSTLFCKEETVESLGMEPEWIPLGSLAVGVPSGEAPPRPAIDVTQFLRGLD